MITRLPPCIVSNRRVLAGALALRRLFSAISPRSDDTGLFLQTLKKKELSPADIVNKPAAKPLPVARALPPASAPSTPVSGASAAKPVKSKAPDASRSFRTLLDSLTLDKVNDVSVWHQLRWLATDPVGRRRFLKAQGLKRVALIMEQMEGLYPLTAAMSAFNVWASGRSAETRAAILASGWAQAAAVAVARQAVRGTEGETIAKFWRCAEFFHDGLHAMLKPRDEAGLTAGGRPASGSHAAADGGAPAPGADSGVWSSADDRGLGSSSLLADAHAAAGTAPAGLGLDTAQALLASELAAQLAVPAVLKPLLQALAEAEASLRRSTAQVELLRQRHFRAKAEKAGRDSSGGGGGGGGSAGAGLTSLSLQRDDDDDGGLLSLAATHGASLPPVPPVGALVRLLDSVADVLIVGSKGSATANKEARVAAAKARRAAARAKAAANGAAVVGQPPASAPAPADLASTGPSLSPPAAAPAAAAASYAPPKAVAEASAFATSSEAAADLFEPVVQQLLACGVLATAVRSIAGADLLSPGLDRPPENTESSSSKSGGESTGTAAATPPSIPAPAPAPAPAAASAVIDLEPVELRDHNHDSSKPLLPRPVPLMVEAPQIYLRLVTNLAATSRAAADALFVAGAGEVAAGHLASLRPQRLSKRQAARYAQLAGLLRSMDMARQRLSSSLVSPSARDVVMKERYRSVAAASASVVAPVASMLSLWRRGDDRDFAFKALALLTHLSRWHNSPAAAAVGAAAASVCCPDGTLVLSRSSPLASDPMYRSMLGELEQAGARHRRQKAGAAAAAAAASTSGAAKAKKAV